MDYSIRSGWRIALAGVFLGVLLPVSPAQNPSAADKPPPPQSKKPPVGPAAPQSRHYPILLIAQGSEPSWNLRLGMKGPERLERAGYPPIPLEPGEVEQEATGASWIYHGKDSQTSAIVAVHVSRETCSDGVPDSKYAFRVVVEHAQIGSLKGCARVAPDQFPEFKQKNLDDDDPEKKKPGPAVITNFKPPVATAFLDSTGKVMLARGEGAKLVAPAGSQLSLSHDGKRLLFLRQDAGSDRTILLYDAASGKAAELYHGLVQQPFWSPDDSKIAFLKMTEARWHVWTAPSAAPDNAAQLSATEMVDLHGWLDTHTVLAADSKNLYFLGENGQELKTVPLSSLYGNAFSSGDAIRANPVNSDLLLVSAVNSKPAPATPGDPHPAAAAGVSLYELKADRQVSLRPPNLSVTSAEWSRDGMQIFFTGRDSARNTAIYKMFWDGSVPKKVRAGSNLVIGQ
jgi:uncharacterized membrane protein